MKIVRIIARLNVGGPARHVVWLTQALNNHEFSSILVAGSVPEGEESMEYFAAEHDVSPIYIREMSRELSPKDIFSFWKIFNVLRRERPDVIHTHTAKAGTVGRTAGLLYKILFDRGVKLVHTYHGHVFHSYYGGLKTRLFLAIERGLARFATDRIITITEQQKEEIHGMFGVGREAQFEIVPLGIDLERFEGCARHREEFRTKLGVAPDEFVVGFVGRLAEIKNIPMLIDAAVELFKVLEPSRKVRFVVIGDGALRVELENRSVEKGLGERFLFAGNRDDAEVFYSGLDVVALTSLNEGTPLSLIEAMACGKPVIATAVGGVVDLLGPKVEAGEGFVICDRGIAVASSDISGFSKGLVRLLSDSGLRERLSSEGRFFVTSRFGKDRLIAETAELYRRLGG